MGGCRCIDMRQRLKTCEKMEAKRTSGESFVLFVIYFAELDFVGVLWKQTQMVKNIEIAEQSTEN